MGEGLKRARAAADATRLVKCFVCGKTVKLHLQSGRMPTHINSSGDSLCRGSGQLPRLPKAEG